MSTEVSNNTVQENNSTLIVSNVIGSVKWFNNRFGYGFLVATGEHSSYGDVFVHHSELKITDSNIYKFLTQGEYVQFNIVKTSGGKHEYQAANVTGVNGGKLLCENNTTSSHNRNYSRQQYDDRENNTENVDRFPRKDNTRVYKQSTENTRRSSSRTGNGNGAFKNQRNSQDDEGYIMPRSRSPRETPYKTAAMGDRQQRNNV